MAKYRQIVGIGGGDEVYNLTSSLKDDKRIAVYIVRVLAAHLLALASKNLVPVNHACKISKTILELLDNIPPTLFEGSYEDFFESLEDWLSSKLGTSSDYLWLGRSRNDHVSAALRLFLAEKSLKIMRHIINARCKLLELASRYSSIPVVLRTHERPSQVAQLSCLLLAWEEALASSTRLLISSLDLVLRSPLGSSAGAGSLVDLPVEDLALMLGFKIPIYNSVFAAGSRLDHTACLASVALFIVEASRIARDLIDLSSPFIDLIELPENHIATSSIMPHKRNPVTLEVARARAGRAIGCLSAVLAIQHGLPYSYNLDLQEANKCMYIVFDDAESVALILESIFEGIRVKEAKAKLLAENYGAWGAEAVEALSLQEGLPARKAYSIVANALSNAGEKAIEDRLGRSLKTLWLLRRTGCGDSKLLSMAKHRLDTDRKLLQDYLSLMEKSVEALVSKLKVLAERC